MRVVATGQDEDVPTGKDAAIDRIQAMRARIRSGRPTSYDDAAAEPVEPLPPSDATTSPSPADPPDDLLAALAQRDITIEALRAETALLRREVAAIAARLRALGAEEGECGGDG